jgi:shikimate kinase
MASGKTTVGRALAARAGCAFADTDGMVERDQGRDVETIFRESGEGAFRQAEWDILQSLTGRRHVVVATGGGLFLGVAHRALIRAHGVSCWLDAPMDVVVGRARGGDARPLWPAGDAIDRRAFFERRRAAYALADLRVDASIDGPDAVASAIARAWDAFFC